MKKRAKNNRTTFVTEDEIKKLKKRIATPSTYNTGELNKTINGDLFEIAPLLSANSVDLLFIDSPYNLNKDFGNNKFRKNKADVYEKNLRIPRRTETVY